MLTLVHVAAPLAGLALGAAPLRYPNGTPRHRRRGKGSAWAGPAAPGSRSPFLFMQALHRRLDRRYGFARGPGA